MMVLMVQNCLGIKREQDRHEDSFGDDEEWSDSEKTPSVSSGLEGGGAGGSGLSSPITAPPAIGDEDQQQHHPGLPPPPRLPLGITGAAGAATETEIRLRLAALAPEDAKKRLASLGDEYERIPQRDRQTPSRGSESLGPPEPQSPKATITNCTMTGDEDCGVREDDAGGRASVSSSSGSSATGKSAARRRRDSADSRRSVEDLQGQELVKRPRLHEDPELQLAAAPRLRLNASLATDPALRPQAVAALTLKPDGGPSPPLSVGLQNAIASGRLYMLPGDLPKDNLVPDCPVTAPNVRPPGGLICTPCGIRFSSPSTLEAHKTFYCAHRPRVDASDAEANDDDEESGPGGSKAPGSRPQYDGHQSQQPKKAYACPHCSYSADKKVSLNRHMRMHASSPLVPMTAAQAPAIAPLAIVNSAQVAASLVGPMVNNSPGLPANGALNEEAERYCRNCDIRFSSLKNFRAHKLHYCSTRHVVKDTLPPPIPTSSSSTPLKASPPTSSSPGDSPPPSITPGQGQLQPCLALPTNPILIVPYSLFRGASVLSAPALPSPDTPCFLLPNGSLQPMTKGLTATTNSTSTPSSRIDNVLRAVNKPQPQQLPHLPIPTLTSQQPSPAIAALSCPTSPSSCSGPLDLSVRRSPSQQDEKENRESPNQSALGGSPRSRSSASPRARSLSGTTTPLANASPAELALRVGVPVPGVLVKQGVSKCKECNIVFCRHENFVAHKKHYCQARENATTSPPPSETPSPPLVQLICAACGIKFASMDNLAAHQAFYCLKRPESQDQLTRCSKCKVVIEPGASHTCSNAQSGGWRCPVCGAVSPTAGAAQRHMDAHQGVKAFRCTICRYKGNTLRGMRTHIRMHFEKRGTDLQEESYITCVLDDDSTAAPALVEPVAATTPEEIPAESNQINGKNEAIIRKTSPVPPRPPSAQTPRLAPSPLPIGAGNKVKLEREETPPPSAQPATPQQLVAPDDANSNDSGKTGPCYCQSCDIRFSYRSTFIAHKKYYCSSHAGEASNNNNNNNNNNNGNPGTTSPAPAPPTSTPPSARSEASVL